MRLTWLWQIILCWGTASVVAAVLWARIRNEEEDVEQELRKDVLAELRAHAWEN